MTTTMMMVMVMGYRARLDRETRTLATLRDIYHQNIRPVEMQFHYADLKRHILSGSSSLP